MYKFLSAALLAATLSAQAAPPQKVPSEIYTAIQAIKQELNAQLQSGKTSTPEQKAALRSVFNEEPALILRPLRTNGKASLYEVALPGGEYRHEERTSKWPATLLRISKSASDISTSGKWDNLEIKGTDFQITAQNILLDTKFARAPAGTPSSMQLRASYFDLDEGEFKLHLQDPMLKQVITSSQNRKDLQFDFSSKRMSAGPMTADQFHLGFRLHNADLSTLENISASNSRNAFALFQTLMAHGASMDLQDLSLTLAGKQIRANGNFSMPGLKSTDFSTIDTMLNMIDARLNIEIPTAALREVISQAVQGNARQPDSEALDKKVSDIYAYVLGKAIANNYAQLDKDKLASVIEIKQGQVSINGSPDSVPLSKLFRAMEQMQSADAGAKEEDRQLPAAIHWRDRSLDNLLLFAGNGTLPAQRELCYRYTRQQDHEQANRWCKKAGIQQPPALRDNEERTPPEKTIHYTVGAGRYEHEYFRFDANKSRRMQIKLDKIKNDQKWAPMMAICLTAETPSDAACIEIHITSLSDTQLVVSATRIPADAREKHTTQRLEQTLPLQDSIDLVVYASDKHVHFILNDTYHLSQEATFPAEAFTLMCSTADCSFSFP